MPASKSRICLLAVGLAAVAGVTAGAARPASSKDQNMLVYIGTYTNAKSKGIYAFRMDPNTGHLTPVGLVAETPSPSYLAFSPNHKYLVAANEVSSFGGEKAGAVSSFSINADTGKLTQLSQQSSKGDGPCHIWVDNTGKSVFVANYGAGSIAALPLGADGKLSPASAFVQHKGTSVNPQRQEGPHAHCVMTSPDNKFLLAADLGLDKVLVYHLDPVKGTLTPNDPPAGTLKPGSGPRHIAFYPSGKYAYVINEMGMTVTAFNYDAKKGTLKEFQSLSTVAPGTTGKDFSTAELRMHPSGKFLYGTNRGHHSIAIYSIDQNNGHLTFVAAQPSGVKTPRGMGIDPSGKFLIAAGQDSDNLTVFRIDQTTGKLTQVGGPIPTPSPVDVEFLP
jgi:6-phosphogluconolactonase